MDARVSVVIPAYNPGRYLRKAVDSVFAQTFDDWTLLIVDDGSTDGSIDRLMESVSDPRLSVLRSERNQGQARALNLALRHVATPYMIQLDADDWLSPLALETLVNEADQQPTDVGIVSGNCVVVLQKKNGRLIPIELLRRRSFSDRYDFLLANMSLYPRFYRTEALRRIGGWPVDGPYRGRYLEDLSILLRLIEVYRFHWINANLYYYRRHHKNQTNRRRKLGRVVRWTIRSALKRWGGHWRPVFRTTADGWVKLSGLRPARKMNRSLKARQSAPAKNRRQRSRRQGGATRGQGGAGNHA